MSSLVVREAGTEDLIAVMQLERGAPEAPHWTESQYAEIVNSDSAENPVMRCLFVTELDQRIVGFAVGKVLGRTGDLAELESVVVDSAVRRMGAGKALCGAVSVWCRSLGAEELELEVRAESVGAIALYRRLGFVEIGRRPAYYQEPRQDALLMRLNLCADE